MISIDYNLPHTHAHNVEAAAALGRVWDEKLGRFVPVDTATQLSLSNDWAERPSSREEASRRLR